MKKITKRSAQRRRRKAVIVLMPPNSEQVELARWILGSNTPVRVSKRALAIAEETLIAKLSREDAAKAREHARKLSDGFYRVHPTQTFTGA